jgi:hypothetical protein
LAPASDAQHVVKVFLSYALPRQTCLTIFTATAHVSLLLVNRYPSSLPCCCRVRGILDTALTAANSGGASDASTPASVLQQLAHARVLYDTDKAASWGIVERVLADVEDAEVC